MKLSPTMLKLMRGECRRMAIYLREAANAVPHENMFAWELKEILLAAANAVEKVPELEDPLGEASKLKVVGDILKQAVGSDSFALGLFEWLQSMASPYRGEEKDVVK